MKRPAPVLLFLSLLFLLGGCLVGPNYQKPRVSVPTTYRGPDNSGKGAAGEASFGDQQWATVFQTPNCKS